MARRSSATTSTSCAPSTFSATSRTHAPDEPNVARSAPKPHSSHGQPSENPNNAPQARRRPAAPSPAERSSGRVIAASPMQSPPQWATETKAMMRHRDRGCPASGGTGRRPPRDGACFCWSSRSTLRCSDRCWWSPTQEHAEPSPGRLRLLVAECFGWVAAGCVAGGNERGREGDPGKRSGKSRRA